MFTPARKTESISGCGDGKLSTRIKVAFQYQWPSFTIDIFKQQFPSVFQKYDFVLAEDPEIIFYSVFYPPNEECWPDGRQWLRVMPTLPDGDFVRVFITGENVEPAMDRCDFAISFSTQIDHPNHLSLPLWVYDIRRWGFTPESLIKRKDTDWECVAATKTHFCNFVYSHPVVFRNSIFRAVTKYRRADAAGRCENNMNGWVVPNDFLGKIAFIQPYKFTLAVENSIWPGYVTEKLVQPMLVNSIPIYVGDPLVGHSFNRDSIVDYTCFGSMRQMVEFVRQVDNDQALYLKMLAAPFFKHNLVPVYAGDDVIVAFFDRIFLEVLNRR